MKYEEMIDFILQIQKDYPRFKLSEEEYKIWQDTLSKISYEIALEKYQEHKENKEFGKKAPNVKHFMSKTIQSGGMRYVRHCRYCGKMMYNDALDLHEDRHRSVNYIIKRKKEIWNKETTKQEANEFMDMPQDEFDTKYYEFLKKVKEKSTNSYEKKNIEKIIYLTEHPREMIPADEEIENEKEKLLEKGKLK